jgi:lipoprotein-anchoring transpeptidase ErfK/SrfK
VKRVLFALLTFAIGSTALLTRNTAYARGDLVTMNGSFAPGTMIVRTNERRLYYVMAVGQAIRYLGVARAGKQWAGTSYVTGKCTYPAWSPLAEIRHDKPNLPQVIGAI